WWGGVRSELATDMTITAGGVEHAGAAARDIWQRGIRTLKVKVGAGPPEADVQRMIAIRQAAPKARLVADANGGWDLTGARAFLRGLEEEQIPLALFEQ